jgi:hypothetical protein
MKRRRKTMKFTNRFLNILFLVCLAVSLFFFVSPQNMTQATSPAPGIVYTQGTQFVLDGYPFYFAGANSYDLFTKSTAEIDTRMADMKADGIKVVRTWGFSHETWHGFEPQKGVYMEEQFRLFDYIMKSARDNGIKIIITLENYWEAYGGIDTRLAWEGLPGTSHVNRAKFFTNAGCKASYKNYLEHFVNRVNYYTGVPYKDDPTIFSWELMNEPRYQDAGENSTGTTLRAWVDEMAGYIKSLDTKHMVSAGIEGHESKYGFGGDEGNPFIYIHQSPYIDFCTAHPYPDESWANLSVEQAAALVAAWIDDAHNVVGKPFVLEEFNTHSNKEAYWNAMYAQMESKNAAGDNFWNYNDKITSNFDILHGDSILTTVFKPHADKMAAKNRALLHAPLAFNQTAPAGGATGILPRKPFTWEPAVAAATYTLVVSANSDYSSPIINEAGITGTQYTPTVDMAFGTKYYWKVTAVNSIGGTVASNAGISFTTRTAPAVAPGSFNQTAPTANLVGALLRPVFSWTASTEALYYNLVVSTSSSLINPVINVSYLAGTSYTPTADLGLNTTYYWKVTAVNNIGSTAASNGGISFVTVDLPPITATGKIQAMLNGNSTQETQYKVVVKNTGGGVLDTFTARIYLDLTEVYAGGYTYSNVVVESLYDQSSGKTTLSGPYVWDAANKIYYVKVDWNYQLADGASIEQDLRVRLSGWQSAWNGANDYSYTGLGSSFADTQYIPLYRGNLKMWGTDPGQTVTPTPTPVTVTPTPVVTATPTPVRTATPVVTATPTPVRTATPVITATPTPVRTATPVVTATPTPVRTATPVATATPTPVPTATPVVTATPVPTTGSIKVQFYNQNTAATSNQIYLNVKLLNIGSSAVSLSDVKIRYYYTIDGTKPQVFYCDYSSAGSGNVTGTFTTMSTVKTGADTYLEIGFTSGAGNLAAGGNTTVQARVAKNDWSNYTQTGDYSFNSSGTGFSDWTQVTGYVSGVLQWGVEP